MTDSRPIALVTGAASGIGLAIATRLAATGWDVALNDRDGAACQAAALAVGGLAIVADVSTDTDRIAEEVLSAFGRLDGLVNNAALLRPGDMSSADLGGIDLAWQVNVRAPMALAARCLPALVEAHGAIVNVSSVGAVAPVPNAGAYTVAKAAMSAFTRQAALDWGPLGVRVNSIAPGLIRSPMTERSWTDERLAKRRTKRIPLRRPGTPEDVAEAALFLLSPRAGFVNGTVITVDGGFSMSLFVEDDDVSPNY